MSHVRLEDILEGIKGIPQLNPQERRLVLRELTTVCNETDLHLLVRLVRPLLTHSVGHDPLSILPIELFSRIMQFVGSSSSDKDIDEAHSALLRCRLINRTWRDRLDNEQTLWKSLLLQRDPADCLVVSEYLSKATRGQSIDLYTDVQESKCRDQSVFSRLLEVAKEKSTKGRSQSIIPRWEYVLSREIALRKRWKEGTFVERTIVWNRWKFRAISFTWPYLVTLPDGQMPQNFQIIDLETSRNRQITAHQHRLLRNKRCSTGAAYETVTQLPADASSFVAMDWDSSGEPLPFGKATELKNPLQSTSLKKSFHLPSSCTGTLAMCSSLRNLQVCDIETKKTFSMKNHMGIGYINFVRFLRETIVMVASSSMVIFFQKDDQLKPINSFHAPHQVTSVATVDFWKCFARHDSSDKEFRWREAVCLGDRFGVSVVDDKGVVISRIDLQDDCELLHFQAFVNTLSTTVDGVDSKHAVVDDKDQGRNGLMILYVRPVDRRRGVVWIKMEQGYREEISRRELERDSLIEGLGKYNPTDSTVMFRDKIAIVNHDRCILNQVHRCELRVVDTANKTCFATERYKEDEESMVMSKFRLKDSHWDNGSDKETMEWEDSESEIEVEVEEEEEDEDWDEEEGEEDGKGEKGEKDEERSKDAKHVEYEELWMKKGKKICLKKLLKGRGCYTVEAMDHARIVLSKIHQIDGSTVVVLHLS